MKKIIISTFIIIAIFGGIVVSLYMMKISGNKESKIEKNQNFEVSDKITDECVEEYNNLEIAKEEVEETTSKEEEKVSPNANI